MTFSEIDEILPNGFHDAKIEQMTWDFQKNTAIFDMEFWVATEQSNPEVYRKGKVELRNILFIAIDPPRPSDFGPKPYRFKAHSLNIDGQLTDERIFPGLHPLKQQLPSDIEIFSFYVEDWNSFIHISAEAELVWK